MKRIRKHLSFANVVACLALLIALGGASYAAVNLPPNSVGSPQIKKKAVQTSDIALNAIRTGRLAPEAAKAGKIAKNAIATNRRRDNAVSTKKIGDNAVSTGKLGPASVTTEKIADDAVDQAKLGAASVGATELKAVVVRTNRVVVPNGGSEAVVVGCQADEQVVGAGTKWGTNGSDRYTNYVYIFGNGAQARGNQFTGGSQTFYVEAYCLAN
ncbi:MAG: hypothetical protein R2725_12410 [Solirubrobacterales bacterium]